MDSFEQELIGQVEKRNKLEQMSADYMEKIGVFTGEEGTRERRVRFEGLFKVKSFSQEE